MAMLQEREESLPREELEKLQSERLIWQVKRTYENVECFRNRMDEAGLKPEDIKGIEDLHKIPFSYKKSAFADLLFYLTFFITTLLLGSSP